jgi:hypothetical protein
MLKRNYDIVIKCCLVQPYVLTLFKYGFWTWNLQITPSDVLPKFLIWIFRYKAP